MFGGTVNKETFRYSQEYFFYITLGIPFYMFGQAMNPIIRAGRQPEVRHDLHIGRRCYQHCPRPDFHLCLANGA